MIQKLILKNFRNFEDQEFLFDSKKNIIVGENGHGKTNVLEALCLFSGSSLIHLDFNSLITLGKSYFYLESTLSSGDSLSLHYEGEKNKKTYSVNKKPCSKAKFLEASYTTVLFSPIIMNMSYLGPTLRREFLDTLLSHSFPEYSSLLSKYKTILKNRNKFLRSIAEGKSLKKDITFWDTQFSDLAASLYAYRFHASEYIADKINICDSFFGEHKKNTIFIYKTKVSKNSIKHDIADYLETNLDRDVIIGKTNIGPHIDDFDIYIDDKALADFASRGEVKSTIIALKLIEAEFIEYKTGKKPILLIDDLLSELDNTHRDYLLSSIGPYQTFITSIYGKFEGENVIKL